MIQLLWEADLWGGELNRNVFITNIYSKKKNLKLFIFKEFLLGIQKNRKKTTLVSETNKSRNALDYTKSARGQWKCDEILDVTRAFMRQSHQTTPRKVKAAHMKRAFSITGYNIWSGWRRLSCLRVWISQLNWESLVFSDKTAVFPPWLPLLQAKQMSLGIQTPTMQLNNRQNSLLKGKLPGLHDMRKTWY